jgi:hypothetical protein
VGVLEQERLEIPRGQGQSANRLDRDDLGQARLAVEDRKLAEEFPGTKLRQVSPIADDSDATVDDDEEAGPDLVLAGDDVARLEVDLGRARRDVLDDLAIDAAEQAAGDQQIDMLVVGLDHVSSGPASGRAHSPAGAGSRKPCCARAARPVNHDVKPTPQTVHNTPDAMPVAGHPAREEAPVATREEIIDALADMALFADLSTPQLADIAGRFEEEFFPEGQTVLRQGLRGSGFHVILEGEASVVIDGSQRATLRRGEYFGEVSVLLDEPPTADIVAIRSLRCLVLGGPDLEPFLLAHPRVLYRMLIAQTRRLRTANRWRN